MHQRSIERAQQHMTLRHLKNHPSAKSEQQNRNNIYNAAPRVACGVWCGAVSCLVAWRGVVLRRGLVAGLRGGRRGVCVWVWHGKVGGWVSSSILLFPLPPPLERRCLPTSLPREAATSQGRRRRKQRHPKREGGWDSSVTQQATHQHETKHGPWHENER